MQKKTRLTKIEKLCALNSNQIVNKNISEYLLQITAMSTQSFDNNDYASVTCTQTVPTVQIMCKCKRSNQSKDIDSVIKIRCNEKNCINRIDSNDNGITDEIEWILKETRYQFLFVHRNSYLHEREKKIAIDCIFSTQKLVCYPSLILKSSNQFPWGNFYTYWNFSHFRYSDGTVKLRNPHIELMDQDILYHLALGSGSHDLVEMFGDVKVCIL